MKTSYLAWNSSKKFSLILNNHSDSRLLYEEVKMYPLRILFLCFEPKGLAIYVRSYHLAKELSRKGHDVTLIAVSPESLLRTVEETNSCLKVILTPNLFYGGPILSRLTSCQGWGILDIYKRIKVGMSSKFDIIQLFDHFPNIAIPFNYLRKRSSAKFVSDWCDLHHLPGGFRDTLKGRFDVVYKTIGFPFRKYLNFVEVDIRKKADAVTVISHKLKEIAIEQGIREEKLTVIEGGVDIDIIKPLPKMEAREKLGLPLNGSIIEFMGRHQSDLDIVIKSFASLKQELRNSYLLIVGTPDNWNKKLAIRYGIIDNYIEAGYCSDDLLPYYLACADLFVLPYKKNLANEARWANKFGEYLAAGRPTVISNVSAQACIIRKHEVGLVADNSIEDFTQKMKKLLKNNALSMNFGINARKLACEKYSWKKLAEKVENIYYQIL